MLGADPGRGTDWPHRKHLLADGRNDDVQFCFALKVLEKMSQKHSAGCKLHSSTVFTKHAPSANAHTPQTPTPHSTPGGTRTDTPHRHPCPVLSVPCGSTLLHLKTTDDLHLQ